MSVAKFEPCTVLTFNSFTECGGSPDMINNPTSYCQPVSWEWMHGRPLIRTWIIDVLGSFFDMLSMGVCTPRHWQTPGRLMQELNVCTVMIECKMTYVQSIVNENIKNKILGS